MKPIVRHARADDDIQEVLAYYLGQLPTVALVMGFSANHGFQGWSGVVAGREGPTHGARPLESAARHQCERPDGRGEEP